MEWQPIETAPKDGTRILLLEAGNVYLGLWDSNFGISEIYDPEADQYVNRPAWTDGTVKSWGYEEQNEIEQPTHWMPLPDPPASMSIERKSPSASKQSRDQV